MCVDTQAGREYSIQLALDASSDHQHTNSGTLLCACCAGHAQAVYRTLTHSGILSRCVPHAGRARAQLHQHVQTAMLAAKSRAHCACTAFPRSRDVPVCPATALHHWHRHVRKAAWGQTDSSCSSGHSTIRTNPHTAVQVLLCSHGR